MQLPYTWGYVDSIYRIRRSKQKVVIVVEVGGNQKAISGGMGRVFPCFFLADLLLGRSLQPAKTFPLFFITYIMAKYRVLVSLDAYSPPNQMLTFPVSFFIPINSCST